MADNIQNIRELTDTQKANIVNIVNYEELICNQDDTIRMLLDSIPEVLLLISREGKVLTANAATAVRLSRPLSEIIGHDFCSLFPSEVAAERKKRIDFVIHKKMPTRFQDERLSLILDNQIHPLLDGEGKVAALSFFSQDITSRKKIEDELYLAKVAAEQAREQAERMAKTDYLTGLLNRWAFAERFETEMDRAEREKNYFSMIMADIDHFKRVNDVFGHAVGDMVLREFSACLLRSCRSYDFLGRHGGEEFIIGLPDTTSLQAVEVAERMRRSVAALKILIPGVAEAIQVTASFGVATALPGTKESLKDLSSRADKAMYQAKKQGRNRVNAIVPGITISGDECDGESSGTDKTK